MKRLCVLATFLSAFSFSALSENLATVTSASEFVLDGHPINTPGVTSFPVVSGDTITTSQGSLIVLFKDGTSAKLAPNSSLKIIGTAAAPKLVVLSGSIDQKSNTGKIVSSPSPSSSIVQIVPVSRHL